MIDRFIQQAVAQRLSQAYERLFSPNSHGFRPNRSCHTAINQALAYANRGKRWVVDLDLEKFFDTVNHAKLIQVLSERIKDGRVISLIHKMLRAPVSENGKVTQTEIGTPQGGCISPVLTNIVLNELDQELDRRGHAFVRYADDMMVMCGSKKAAQRVYQSLRTFIEKKLKLKVNEQKSKICYINASELKFLGYGFYRDKEGVVKARVHQKSYEKCKRKLRELTSRSKGQSLDTYRERLSEFIRGWVNYFKLASMKHWVQETDQWLRRRIRQIYWKQWKTVSMRSRALRQLGVSKEKAWEWANTRKAYWRVAGSHILSTTLTNDFLKARGWMCLKVALRATSR